MNQLILGDCLEVMKKMDSESVDLIYLDPPFFSNRNYEVIWGDKGEVRSFEDRWSGGIEHYIAWLKERIAEMHRLLKPTGSIYLHCDWHANANIRVHILDKIFGENNFHGEIIWKRTTAHNTTSRKLGILTDTIFFYSKSNNYFFIQPQALLHNEEYSSKHYRHKDTNGRLYRTHLVERNAALGIRPNLIYEYKGYLPKWGWMMEREKLEKLDELGKLVWNSKGTPQRKIYLDEVNKPVVGNLWDDIQNIQSSKEKIGYPTQKPEALLERIIKMATNEGDIVFDPFVGGGTTVAVADKLGRKWIGIDQSVQAIKVSEYRLNKQQDLFSQPFTVQLHKYDYDTLFNQNPKIFETWIVERFGGRPNMKKGSDKGIDGKMQDGTPIQVKQSNAVGSMPIRQLITDARANDKMLYEKNFSEGKPIAYFIAFSYGKGAVQEVARLKNEENIIVKLVTVEEIVPIAKKPKLTVTITDLGEPEVNPTVKRGADRAIQFTALAESEAGIEMYAWDWDYEEDKPFKAEIILDKSGTQTMKFKPGNHTIAVKAVDNDGLEAIEVIKIKVNGVVERG